MGGENGSGAIGEGAGTGNDAGRAVDGDTGAVIGVECGGETRAKMAGEFACCRAFCADRICCCLCCCSASSSLESLSLSSSSPRRLPFHISFSHGLPVSTLCGPVHGRNLAQLLAMGVGDGEGLWADEDDGTGSGEVLRAVAASLRFLNGSGVLERLGERATLEALVGDADCMDEVERVCKRLLWAGCFRGDERASGGGDSGGASRSSSSIAMPLRVGEMEISKRCATSASSSTCSPSSSSSFTAPRTAVTPLVAVPRLFLTLACWAALFLSFAIRLTLPGAGVRVGVRDSFLSEGEDDELVSLVVAAWVWLATEAVRLSSSCSLSSSFMNSSSSSSSSDCFLFFAFPVLSSLPAAPPPPAPNPPFRNAGRLLLMSEAAVEEPVRAGEVEVNMRGCDCEVGDGEVLRAVAPGVGTALDSAMPCMMLVEVMETLLVGRAGEWLSGVRGANGGAGE